MVCLFLFLISVSDLRLRSQTCYRMFQISQYFIKSSISFHEILGNPQISALFLRISSTNIVIFVFLFGWSFSFCTPFIIFWHVCVFYPYLEVYGHILGMCYNFTDQDFVVFPASATTSLIFCEIMYIQPSLSNS